MELIQKFEENYNYYSASFNKTNKFMYFTYLLHPTYYYCKDLRTVYKIINRTLLGI